MRSRYVMPFLTGALAFVWGCGAAPGLETRTFELNHMDAASAHALLAPYVYPERPGEPGHISFDVASRPAAITVRERPENVEQIARVLAEYDRPSPTVRLHFQVIEIVPDAEPDPAIADVEAALRDLFRFEGFQRTAEAVIQATPFARIHQPMIGAGGYQIDAVVEDARGHGDTRTVRLRLDLGRSREALLGTTINVRDGQTMVVGTAAPSDGAPIILTVRASFEEP